MFPLGRAGGGKGEGTSLVQGEGHSCPGITHLTKNILPLLSLQGPASHHMATPSLTLPEGSRPRSSVRRQRSGTGHLPPEGIWALRIRDPQSQPTRLCEEEEGKRCALRE